MSLDTFLLGFIVQQCRWSVRTTAAQSIGGSLASFLWCQEELSTEILSFWNSKLRGITFNFSLIVFTRFLISMNI